MQEPENSDIWELADMTLGAVAIQQPKSSRLDEEQEFLNVCLIKILDYCLEILSDDAVWDIVAEAILSETKTKL